MKRKNVAIGISTVSVVLLTLTSLSNVVGYQTIQSSNHSIIKERISQRELLFQTIVDIVNNKEIQRIILKYQMSRGEFPVSNIPVLTKNQLKQMYFIGLILSKLISTSKIQSMIGKYQFNNQETQKEISAVIQKDATLNADVTQLQNSECDCDDEPTINWNFPVICLYLLPLVIFVILFDTFSAVFWLLVGMYPPPFWLAGRLYDRFDSIGYKLQCFWWYYWFFGYGPNLNY